MRRKCKLNDFILIYIVGLGITGGMIAGIRGSIVGSILGLMIGAFLDKRLMKKGGKVK